MKKLMFAVIAYAMILSGYSSEDDCTTVSPQPEKNAMEVKLNVGTLGVATRAPVPTNDNTTASFVASTTDGDHTANVWNSTVILVASPTPTSAFSLSPVRYYPVNSLTIYIKGYYPAGALTGKSVTLAADGTEDVMVTVQASGTKAIAIPLSLILNHLLTQLQFKFISGTGYPASGVNVTSFVTKQQRIPAILDLNTVAMTHTTKDLTLSGTFPITTAGATVNNYPMVKSGEALSVAVIISDGATYSEVAISITAEAEKSHLITLIFTPKETTAAINVTTWQVRGQGSSPLQQYTFIIRRLHNIRFTQEIAERARTIQPKSCGA